MKDILDRHLTLFHSLEFLNEIQKWPGRKVWIPDIPENEIYIEHLLNLTLEYKGKYFIEECLTDIRPKNPAADIQVFTIPKSDFPLKPESKIVIYPQSDTLAVSAYKIYQKCDPDSTRIMVPRNDLEGSRGVLLSSKVPHETYSYHKLRLHRPDAFLLFNDWTKEAQRIMAHCHWLKIPVICVQESVIDFGDSFRRMQHADYAFVQGSNTYSDLQTELMFITGNPRYENLAAGRSRNPADPVLINCNFTYDIHENIRYSWLDQVITQLDELKIEYQITQHPRDHGDLTRYPNSLKTSTGSVHDMIRSSSILITRFSSLIHESLIMGIPVIYYNPHRETMQYDFQCNDSFLQMAYSEEELRNALFNLQNNKDFHQGLNEYLTRHCLPHSSDPTTIIAFLLATSGYFRARIKMIDLIRIILFLPIIRNVYYRVKGIFTRSK